MANRNPWLKNVKLSQYFYRNIAILGVKTARVTSALEGQIDIEDQGIVLIRGTLDTSSRNSSLFQNEVSKYCIRKMISTIKLYFLIYYLNAMALKDQINLQF